MAKIYYDGHGFIFIEYTYRKWIEYGIWCWKTLFLVRRFFYFLSFIVLLCSQDESCLDISWLE